VSEGRRQQCAGPLAKPSRTAPGVHIVQLASKPPSAPALHWHLARDHILCIYAHSATIGSTKQRNTRTPKKNTVVLAASLRSALRIRCWCCTTALRLCYLRWCRQHRILMLFQDNGTRLRRAGRLRQISLDVRFSSIAWTSDTSLVLHFQSSLCTVVAVHSLRSLESAELYVFITQQLSRISRWIPSTGT